MCNLLVIISNKPAIYFRVCKTCSVEAEQRSLQSDWELLKSERLVLSRDVWAGGFSDIRSNYKIKHVRRVPRWTAVSFGTRGYEAAAIRKSSKRIPSTRQTEEEWKSELGSHGFPECFTEPAIIHWSLSKAKRNMAFRLGNNVWKKLYKPHCT